MAANQLYWVVILASPDTYGGWLATNKCNYTQTLESDSSDEGQSWSAGQPWGPCGAATFAVYGTPTN